MMTVLATICEHLFVKFVTRNGFLLVMQRAGGSAGRERERERGREK